MSLFTVLFDLFENLSKICNGIWEWLNKDFSVEIFGYNILNLLGIQKFKPIDITWAVIVIFLGAYLIKKFVPLT